MSGACLEARAVCGCVVGVVYIPAMWNFDSILKRRGGIRIPSFCNQPGSKARKFPNANDRLSASQWPETDGFGHYNFGYAKRNSPYSWPSQPGNGKIPQERIRTSTLVIENIEELGSSVNSTGEIEPNILSARSLWLDDLSGQVLLKARKKISLFVGLLNQAFTSLRARHLFVCRCFL